MPRQVVDYAIVDNAIIRVKKMAKKTDFYDACLGGTGIL